jgi:hypothetical protein
MKIKVNPSFGHGAHDLVQHAGLSMHDHNNTGKSDTTPQHFSSSPYHPWHSYAMVTMFSNPSIVGSSCNGNVIMVVNQGQGHLTTANDDGFVLVEKKKKIASVQPTIQEPIQNNKSL